MNFKKILAISAILIALSLSLSAVSAGTPIELGKIVSAPVEMGSATPSASLPSGFGSSGATQLNKVEFTANIQIDISKMSDADKDLLKKAIEDDNKTVTLNGTADTTMSITLYQGADVSIDGDTLNVAVSSSYSTTGQGGELEISSVEVTGNNQAFVATK